MNERRLNVGDIVQNGSRGDVGIVVKLTPRETWVALITNKLGFSNNSDGVAPFSNPTIAWEVLDHIDV